ncbi:FMN-linked oxidoreductase [Wallemia mellicola]|uniref:FMN-linked oxidoreductase n=1 Tax=Wallemia mellicola TaxID=1708541 RepID=A0AB74K9R7_9BASI|nr:hypothetical protein E3Q24_01595 [Wallemia mellicola]TIB80368.1 FMN-linked oxidoreductase [Wallemia mellicola]TIB84270.1 FMN-linked oxidoreductase [Wallemia mellicola]TIC20502.1 FMN-linked oxidoreductase [Wallemia mellicola]TIC32142.1 FMN-linked oxidoreductase [Wallemia mellicola]
MTAKYQALFKPRNLGQLQLQHRIALAPLTRLRTKGDGVIEDYVPEYYQQRSTKGGFLISEATLIAKEAGSAYGKLEPGLWSNEQLEQWKKVTKSVHDKGAYIYSQLWALGRIANPELSERLVGPSAGTYQGNKVEELSVEDIKRYVNHYKQAAINAVETAGFDGVEIHAANGYLIDQFTQKLTNRRTDEYSAESLKFPSEVLEVVVNAVGQERTGIRLSPFNTFQEMRDENPLATFTPWVEKIVKTYPKLAYIHFVDGTTPEDQRDGNKLKDIIRDAGIAVISNNTYNLDKASKRAEERDEIIAFGKYFIANPDLPDRAAKDLPIVKADVNTFYGGGRNGYTDYPFYK